MKQKIKNWLQNQTKEAKIIFFITIFINLSLPIYQSITKFSYVLSYGIDAFMGRLLGLFLGLITPIILISMVLAFIFYSMFSSVAKRYKQYFDYFAITFFIVSIVLFYYGAFYKPF
jgi:hypothetical protein